MFKLMIADDNPHCLQDLSEIIDWEGFGFDLVGTFPNGQQLLDAAKQDYPDLVITDVSMPVMDGMQLASELRLLKPNIKIVFISSYSEFNYARTALKLRIFDYVLKPVRLQQLQDVTGRVLEELRQEQLEYFKQQKIFSQQEYYRKTALSFYISMLLLSAEDDAYIREELIQFGLTVSPEARLILACFSLDTPLDSRNKLQTYSYLHSILEYGLTDVQVIPTLTNNQQSAFLLLCSNHRLGIPDLLSSVCMDIEAKTDLHITLGYSTTSKNFTDLPLLYSQAKVALDHLLKEPVKSAIASYTDVFTSPATDRRSNSNESTQYSENVAIMRTYIEDNYMRQITTDDVAAHIFFSPSYANRCFVNECGITIFGFLTQYRMEKAKQLLSETEESVINIAEKIGYSSKTSFYLAFKRYTGISPTAYRIKNMQQ